MLNPYEPVLNTFPNVNRYPPLPEALDVEDAWEAL